VHSPEFGFEHDLDNVRRAVDELGVRYPVVLDNHFAIWQSLGNRFWPAVYLVDRDARVGFHHFGEGNYEETERAIQQLLAIDEETVRVEAGGVAEAADWDTLASPETYVGFARGQRRIRARADGLALDQWALDGAWSVGEEEAVLGTAGGSIAYRFHARDLNLVLGPPAAAAPIRFTVLLDGRPPGDDHGLDIDESGKGSISEPRMYQLVRQRRGITERTFEITFLAPGRARVCLHLRLIPRPDQTVPTRRPPSGRRLRSRPPNTSTCRRRGPRRSAKPMGARRSTWRRSRAASSRSRSSARCRGSGRRSMRSRSSSCPCWPSSAP
jgi:hypothetical protein